MDTEAMYLYKGSRKSNHTWPPWGPVCFHFTLGFRAVVQVANEIRDLEILEELITHANLKPPWIYPIMKVWYRWTKLEGILISIKCPNTLVRFVGNGEGRPVVMVPYWSAISETGTLGDPTSSSKEKGIKLMDAAVDGLIEFINIYKERDHNPPRVNHHQS